MTRYTVKQLADLAGITTRTLHYYDEIGLLRPTSYGDNGYRYYGEDALLQLQQILFYRELGLRLDEITTMIHDPHFDLLAALETHRSRLQARVARYNQLIETVDRTMQHIRGEIHMANKDFYAGFDEEKQKKLSEEAQRRWGDVVVNTQRRWESYTREEKNHILSQMHEITSSIASAMDSGPQSDAVQQWIDRWYRHINQYFYTCTLEVFEALGHSYTQDPAFTKTYEDVRPGLAAFMEQAMTYYCTKQANA